MPSPRPELKTEYRDASSLLVGDEVCLMTPGWTVARAEGMGDGRTYVALVRGQEAQSFLAAAGDQLRVVLPQDAAGEPVARGNGMQPAALTGNADGSTLSEMTGAGRTMTESPAEQPVAVAG